MIKNYFSVAWRHLYKRKWFSLINILGLAVGIAAGLLSYLHIQYELSYDGFHKNSDRIYRIVKGNMKTGEGWVGISAPIPPKLQADIPEVEEFVRLTKLRRQGKVVVGVDDKFFNEANFFLADPSLFTVFDFKLLQGNAANVFSLPSGMVISASKAQKLFGYADPMGRVVKINGNHEFTVSGIMEDIPHNSHIALDFVVDFKNLENMLPGTSLSGNWNQFNYYGYVLLSEQAEREQVERKIKAMNVLRNEYSVPIETIGLQPLKDIHFVHNRGNLKPSFNKKYLYIFLAAALGLILIALVNFINLKTAGSSKRLKEVGIRKVMGANRAQLIFQFIAESFLITLIALLIAVTLLDWLFLPGFNRLFEANVEFDLSNPVNIVLSLLFALTLSAIAGAYLAFFVSSFSPSRALKTQIKVGSSKNTLRNWLLGVQFLISIILIGASLIINQQLNYISNKKLGVNPHQIINVPLYNKIDQEKGELLRNELQELSGVQLVSLNNFQPGQVNWNQGVWWEGQEEDESMFIIAVDPEFFDVMDITLLEGDPNFIRQSITNQYTYVLNESAVKHIGWQSAIGKQFSAFGETSKKPIAGVVKDFHFQSLHNLIKPLVLVVGDRTPSQLYLKLKASGINQSIGMVKERLSEILPELPFEFEFLDEGFAQLYVQEERARQLLSFYTLVSILLALFGLYALLTFEVNERTKELAIRKILGGSTYHLGQLLSRNFVRIILIASLCGIPLGWWLMNRWLSNFDYRIDLNPLIISAPLIVLLVLILAIVSIKVWNIAKSNPVEELRYE